MVAVLLALLPPLLVGSLAVWSCWPRVGPAAWRAVLAGALGIGLALGATSWTYFAWVVCAGPSRPGFLLVETLFFALLAAALVVAVRRFPAPDGGDLPRPPHTRWTWAIWAAFGLVLLAALATLGLALARTPHGEIDAWQIWNLHARLLTRGGDEWREPFARLSALYHPDYPLLVPAAVARGWTCAGEESTLVPRLVAFLFAAATVGLLVAGLTLLRTPAQGCLAGLVLLATPPYLRYTAAQYGDVPLGLYFLAGVLLFEVRDRLRSGSERLPVLAGVVAGMAAWTKNEGQLFVIATLLARLVVAWAGGRASRPAPRALVAFAAGLLPFAAALAYFKLGVAPTNDLVAGQEGGATLPRLLDGERLWEVVSGMVGPGDGSRRGRAGAGPLRRPARSRPRRRRPGPAHPDRPRDPSGRLRPGLPDDPAPPVAAHLPVGGSAMAATLALRAAAFLPERGGPRGAARGRPGRPQAVTAVPAS